MARHGVSFAPSNLMSALPLPGVPAPVRENVSPLLREASRSGDGALGTAPVKSARDTETEKLRRSEVCLSLAAVQTAEWGVFVAVFLLNAAALGLAHGFGYHDGFVGLADNVSSGQIAKLARGSIAFFDFNHERNLPTLFSVILILQGSLLCAMICTQRVRRRTAWGFLAVIFLGLAVNEFTSLHEELIEPVRSLLGTSQFFYFAWIIPGSLGVMFLAVALRRWLLELADSTRRGFVAAGAFYLTGVLLLEGIGGWRYEWGCPLRC